MNENSEQVKLKGFGVTKGSIRASAIALMGFFWFYAVAYFTQYEFEGALIVAFGIIFIHGGLAVYVFFDSVKREGIHGEIELLQKTPEAAKMTVTETVAASRSAREKAVELANCISEDANKIIDRKSPEEIELSAYELAAVEIEQQSIDKGLWSKAFVKSEGDLTKKKSYTLSLELKN